MSIICEYCKKEYNSKYILTKHQKTTKKCLQIQEQLKSNNKINDDIEIISYKCLYCKKEFTTNQAREKHTCNCIEKFKQEISCLKRELKDKDKYYSEFEQKILVLETENRLLREQSERSTTAVEDIAKQPRINTTNNNHNKILITTPMDLSQPTVQQAIQNGFSDEYLVQGQKGVARFAYDNILKDEQGKLKYICTDAARQIFQFKNEDGSIQKDVKATKLTKALLEGELKSASHKMACDKMKDGSVEEFNMYTDNYHDIKELETDNSDFSKELTTLTA
tara:strand:+ start:226 stop:1062 length:837 start_codon:yes stop_codon:yes gene_type:complete